MITFKYSSASIIDSDIDNIEARFGFKFPSAFRDIYRRFNGGRPERNWFVSDGATRIVDAFLPIKHSATPLSTIERSIEVVKLRRLLPDSLVQFAIDPFGNYYCFSTRECDFGSIYFCAMDSAIPMVPEFLSASLDDFLSRLAPAET